MHMHIYIYILNIYQKIMEMIEWNIDPRIKWIYFFNFSQKFVKK